MWMENVNFPSLETEDDKQQASAAPSMVDCGYEEAIPDHASAASSRSRSRSRSSSSSSSIHNSRSYTEDSVQEYDEPMVDYGYGDAAPDSEQTQNFCSTRDPITGKYKYNSTATPRRSSMKGNNPTSIERRKSLDNSSIHGSEYRVRIRGEVNPVRRRRSIEFNKTVQVANIIPQVHLSDDECDYDNSSSSHKARSKLWYQDHELHQMKHQRNKIVRKMRKGQLDPDEVQRETLLGLEKYYDKNEYKLSKTAAWISVLEEQDEQEMNGQFDDNKISAKYSTLTQSRQKFANDIAHSLSHKDQELIDYQETPRTKRLMMSGGHSRMSRRSSC